MLERMSQWTEEYRPILVAISRASGDAFRDIDGKELLDELRRMGHDPDPLILKRKMDRLRGDGGFVSFYPTNAFEKWGLIRLEQPGRQEVEGWPRAGAITDADYEALVTMLTERADDPDVPEEERSKLRKAVEGVAGLGTKIGVDLLTAWAEKQTGLG